MPKTPTSLRLDPEVKQRLSDLVERTGRSISGHFFDASLQRGEPGFDVGRVGDGEQRTDLRARR